MHPPNIPPMLVTAPRNPTRIPIGEGYHAERKHDGYLAVAGVDLRTGQWVVHSRGGNDITDRYPVIVEGLRVATRGLPVTVAGEITVDDKYGRQNRNELRSARAKREATFNLFDLYAVEDEILFSVPHFKRQKMLSEQVLNHEAAPAFVRFTQPFPADRAAINDFFKEDYAGRPGEAKNEGVIIKKDSGLLYPGRRTPDMVKDLNLRYRTPLKTY